MQANALLSSSFFQLDSLSVYSQQCYDATWTLAKGLDRSATSRCIINNIIMTKLMGF